MDTDSLDLGRGIEIGMTRFSPSKEACPPVLAGLRVLDFSALLPGPFATVILGDLGADIIKVEGPQGDPARTTPGAAKFPGVNRNKRSVALDLKKAGARPIVDALVDWCDVLVEGFRPRVTTRLGIDYDTVSQRKPNIIYCSISGYGQTGPWQDFPGHDPNYLAAAGALAFSGHWLDRPRRSSLPFSDFIGGSLAVISILCALRQLEKSGKGAWLDLSLFEAAMFCTAARFGLEAEHAHRDLLRPTNFTVLETNQFVSRSMDSAAVVRSERRRLRGAGLRSNLERGAGVAGEPRGRKSAGKAGILPRTGCCTVFFGSAKRSARRNPYAAIERVAW